nr:MAG TPA: hypothetical protein [Crassvirales sp.]
MPALNFIDNAEHSFNFYSLQYLYVLPNKLSRY